MIYIFTIFSRDTRKGQTYGHNWSGHNAQYGHIGHYGRYGATNYGYKVDLYECPWKIWSKCRSPVKTVLKKMHPTRFYGHNQKIWEKMAIFGQFPLYNWSNLKSAGTLPQLTQSFWNFLGGLISSTYTYSQLSNIFIKKNEIQHHPTGDSELWSQVSGIIISGCGVNWFYYLNLQNACPYVDLIRKCLCSRQTSVFAKRSTSQFQLDWT